MSVPEYLVREIEALLPVLCGGRLLKKVEENGACHWCSYASDELAQRLPRGRTLALDFSSMRVWPRNAEYWEDIGVFRALTELYPLASQMNSPGHTVFVLDGYVIDLTARQYDMSLAFPLFWQIPTQEATVPHWNEYELENVCSGAGR